MISPIEYLFTLEGSERRVFHVIINLVNEVLVKNNSATERLADILKHDQSIRIILQEYDSDLTDTIVESILRVLEDDASLPFLVDKLHNYRGRVTAAAILGWFGRRAIAVIPDLIELANWQVMQLELQKLQFSGSARRKQK